MNLDCALGHVKPTRRQWRAWTRHEPALAGLSWERLRTELRQGPRARQDELLSALVRVARCDSEAVVVVTGCLVPGLRTRIARYAPGLAADEAWSTAMEGLCAAIGTGDVPTTFVASRLLDEAKRHLQRAVRGEVAWQCQVRQVPDRADHHRTDEPSGALILATAARAGVISRSDAWLLHSTVIAGHSVDHAAGRLAVAYETAKKRRQRAGHRWTAWWAPEHLEPSSSTLTSGEVA